MQEEAPFLTEFPTPEKSGFFSFLRNSFLYGLMIMLPIVATVWLTKFTIHFVSDPLQSFLGDRVPLPVSFLLTLGIVTLVGVFTRNVMGKHVLQFLEDFVQRIPFVSVVYRSSKQIVDGFSLHRNNMMRPAMIEYPRKGTWAIGFLVKENIRLDGLGIGEEISEDPWCAVFVPTAPNPTSGYFVYVRISEVVLLSISAEECVKIVMSVGILSPTHGDR